MAAVNLDKAQWKNYFRGLAPYLEGKQAFVEVAGLALGHRVAAQWTSILGMTYDDKRDEFDLRLGELDHIVHRPSCVYLLSEGGNLGCIEILDANGLTHMVRLRDPLQVPKPPP